MFHFRGGPSTHVRVLATWAYWSTGTSTQVDRACGLSYRIDVHYSTPHNCAEAAPEEADNAEPPSMT